MALQKMGRICLVWAGLPLILAVMCLPAVAQEYSKYESADYGFSMNYPANWVKIDAPKGNYYKVFQAPDLTGKVRPRINVAAHRPVKDAIDVFLNELRNAIKDLQRNPPAQAKRQPAVKMQDEGEFKCDVPGAYFFYIQALEDKANTWMDVVIVFYKYGDTLLRVSCLAPSDKIQEFHKTFNDVLLSVKFEAGAAAVAPPAGAVVVPPSPSPAAPKPVATPPGGMPPGISAPAPVQGPAQTQPPPFQPSVQAQPPAAGPPSVLAQPPAAGPIGPSRQPRGPAAGIVE